MRYIGFVVFFFIAVRFNRNLKEVEFYGIFVLPKDEVDYCNVIWFVKKRWVKNLLK
jgi:hypothetical protein